mgnify:CR=1 FL=1
MMMNCPACGRPLNTSHREGDKDVLVCINRQCPNYLKGITVEGEPMESKVQENNNAGKDQ